MVKSWRWFVASTDHYIVPLLSTGGLLDHVIASHPASGEARARAAGRGVTVYQLLEEVLATLAGEAGEAVTRLRWGQHYHLKIRQFMLQPLPARVA